MGLCKRNTSHRRAKAVPEELFPDAAAAFVGDRFLDSLRSLEMTKRRRRLVEMTRGGALTRNDREGYFSNFRAVFCYFDDFGAILAILDRFSAKIIALQGNVHRSLHRKVMCTAVAKHRGSHERQ